MVQDVVTIVARDQIIRTSNTIVRQPVYAAMLLRVHKDMLAPG